MTRIDINEEMKQFLLNKHSGKLNDYLIEKFGFGIDSLTQSEAGQLRATLSLDEIRARISEAQDAAGIKKAG